MGKSHKSRPRLQTNHKAADGAKLNSQLGAMGLRIARVTADGNCLFRAVADQLEGNEEEHSKYRKMVVDYIEKHQKEYEPFLEDEVPFDEYCKQMREPGTWAGHMELQAISLVTQVNICIHRLLSPRWHIVNFKNTETRCIHLSYHDGEHYNSVRRKDDDGDGPAKPIIIESSDDCEDNEVEAMSTQSWRTGKVEAVSEGGCAKEKETPNNCNQKASTCEGEGESTISQRIQKVARNKACPCGSKKKYKACCGAVMHKPRIVSSSNDDSSSKASKEKLRNSKGAAKIKLATSPADLPDMGYLCI